VAGSVGLSQQRARDRPREHDGPDEADPDAGDGQTEGVPQDHARDIGWVRAQRDADADLARALDDGVGQRRAELRPCRSTPAARSGS